MWERGLKHLYLDPSAKGLASFPMWERGLKHLPQPGRCPSEWVVPHVGTWIETLMWSENITGTTSFPMWERGLKLQAPAGSSRLRSRSPCRNVD